MPNYLETYIIFGDKRYTDSSTPHLYQGFPVIMTYLKPLFTSFSYLVLSGLAFGVVLFLISFVNISSGVLALVAYLSLLCLETDGFIKRAMVGGMYATPLLVGLAIGYLFKITILSLVLHCSLIFSLLLSFTLHSIFSYCLRVPILNLPFTITATWFISSIRYGNLYTVQNTAWSAQYRTVADMALRAFQVDGYNTFSTI